MPNALSIWLSQNNGSHFPQTQRMQVCTFPGENWRAISHNCGPSCHHRIPVVTFPRCRWDHWKTGDSGTEVSLSEVRAVMNRHFYGDQYGLPLDCLKRSFSFEKYIQRYKPPYDDEIEPHFPLEQHAPGNFRYTRLQRKRQMEKQTEPRRKKWTKRRRLNEVVVLERRKAQCKYRYVQVPELY